MLLKSFAHFTSDFTTGATMIILACKHIIKAPIDQFQHFLCIARSGFTAYTTHNTSELKETCKTLCSAAHF